MQLRSIRGQIYTFAWNLYTLVCRPQNHAPICHCAVGYEGDPAIACDKQSKRSYDLISLILYRNISLLEQADSLQSKIPYAAAKQPFVQKSHNLAAWLRPVVCILVSVMQWSGAVF